MPRVARIVIPGFPHHVTQRGNNRQDVFFVDDDRRVYLNLLRKQARHHGVRVLGYCLMANHVHLIAVPEAKRALAKAVGSTHFAYTQYINALHGRSGHLWQNRFRSCPMDDAHLDRAMAYIETNPVRAGLVGVPWAYPWSSAPAHTGFGEEVRLLDLAAWVELWPPHLWRSELSQGCSAEDAGAIRRSTERGRPLATDSVLSKLERALGRRLRPLPRGRPRKREK